jgi:uncharacterized Zn-binding protein involved in type VI secretion
MPPAARLGDLTSHPGAITAPGAPNVLIGGLPAAVQGDAHACASSNPHAPTFFPKGSATVWIGGRQALRIGDACACGAVVTTGAFNVLIGG